MPDIITKLLQLLGEPSKGQKILDPNNGVVEVEGGPMLIPRASLFRPQPEVLGGTDAARIVGKWLKFAPELASRVRQVQVGPSPLAMEFFDDQNKTFGGFSGGNRFNQRSKTGWQPENYGLANILGLQARSKAPHADDISDIYINANVPKDSPELDPIILHELLHSAGHGHKTVNPAVEQYEASLPKELFKREAKKDRKK